MSAVWREVQEAISQEQGRKEKRKQEIEGWGKREGRSKGAGKERGIREQKNLLDLCQLWQVLALL